MSKGQLDHLHDVSVKYQELSESIGNGIDVTTTYTARSLAASNLILIEIVLQYLEKNHE
jgi:hypothetical protein